MEILINTPQIDNIWLNLNLLPDKNELSASNFRGMGTVENIFGEKNEIYIGKPVSYELTKDQLGDMLSQNLINHDLYLIHFSVSFRPNSQCEFVSASIHVLMDYLDETLKSSPSSLDIFPTDVFMPVTYKRSVVVNPELKIDMAKISQIDVSALKLENSKEYILYQPSIIAFGRGTNTPGWDFTKTTAQSVIGIKDLFLLVRREKRKQFRFRIKLSNCQVQTNIGKFPLSTIFLTGTEGELLEDKYVTIN